MQVARYSSSTGLSCSCRGPRGGPLLAAARWVVGPPGKRGGVYLLEHPEHTYCCAAGLAACRLSFPALLVGWMRGMIS